MSLPVLLFHAAMAFSFTNFSGQSGRLPLLGHIA